MSEDLKNLTLEAGHTYGVAVQLDGCECSDGRMQFAIRAVEAISFAEALAKHLEDSRLVLGAYNTVVEVVDLGAFAESDPYEELSVDELLEEIAVLNTAFSEAIATGRISEKSLIETFGISYADFRLPSGSMYESGDGSTLTKIGDAKWASNDGKLIEISDEILAITALGREDFKRVA